MRWQDYLILLLLLGAYVIYLVMGKNRPGSRSRRRREQLTRREETALSRLKVKGYQLNEAHPKVPVTITVDHKSRQFNYQGAFTVRKGGKNYLVKIKRGDSSPLASASLRHEMLLDYLFFQLEGILIYDPEKEKFQELHFKFGGNGPGSEQRMLQVVLLILIAIGVAILYRIIGGS
ncbi:MAG TPA: hypothetical protein GX693_02370 [Firmicutes bacterium]|nr:hypothetical protein [Bacillota bacterium]